LTLHRSHTGVLEEKPVVSLYGFAGALGVRDLVFAIMLIRQRLRRKCDEISRIIALNQVLHDASRLKQVDGLAISELVGQRRDTTIRVDGEEPVFLLCVLADVNLLNLVRETAIVNG
jgi:hypothetical protein